MGNSIHSSMEIKGYQLYCYAGLLVILALFLRGMAAHQYWQWFDANFPLLWESSKIVLSQDANSYISQALLSQAANGPIWTDGAFYRPPLASFYFQLVFQLSNFDRFTVSMVQAMVSVIGYVFISMSIWRLGNPLIALFSLTIFTVHPVLIFYDTSLEDTNLAFLFLAAAFYCLTSFSISRQTNYLLAAGILLSISIMARANILLIALLSSLWLLTTAFTHLSEKTVKTPNNNQYGIKFRVCYIALFYLLPLLMTYGFILTANFKLHGSLFDTISLFGTYKSFDLLQYALLATLLLIYSAFFLHDFITRNSIFSLLFASFISTLASMIFIQSFFASLTICLFFVVRKNQPQKSRNYPTLIKSLKTQSIFLAPIILMTTFSFLHNNSHHSNALVVNSLGQNIYWGNTRNKDYKIYLQGFEFEKWLTKTSPHNSLYENMKLTWSTNTVDQALLKTALHEMKSHPSETAKLLAEKFLNCFANYEIPRNRNYELTLEASPLFHSYYPPFILFFLLGFSGLAFQKVRSNPYYLSLFLLFMIPSITLVITETVIFNASRYRSLGLPFLIPLSLITVNHIIYERQAKKEAGIAALLILSAVFWFAGDRIVGETEKNKYRSASYYKYARTQLSRDTKQVHHGEMNIYNRQEFLRLLEDSLSLAPDNISAFYLLTMYEITHLNNKDDTHKRITQFAKNCKQADNNCRIVTANLLSINKNRKAFKAGNVIYQGY